MNISYGNCNCAFYVSVVPPSPCPVHSVPTEYLPGQPTFVPPTNATMTITEPSNTFVYEIGDVLNLDFPLDWEMESVQWVDAAPSVEPDPTLRQKVVSLGRAHTRVFWFFAGAAFGELTLAAVMELTR